MSNRNNISNIILSKYERPNFLSCGNCGEYAVYCHCYSVCYCHEFEHDTDFCTVCEPGFDEDDVIAIEESLFEIRPFLPVSGNSLPV